MNTALKLLLGIICLWIFSFMSNAIFNFLNIKNSSYQMYIYWISALIIFWMVLPNKVGKMFSSV
jgi:hypothetical protein